MISLAQRQGSTANLFARGAVLIALTLATGALLTVIPIGSVWVAAQATDSIGEHFVAAVPLTMLAMAIWMFVVVWLNELYLQLDGTIARAEAEVGAGWRKKRLRGPAEPLLVFWFFVALIALTIWFFSFDGNPPRQVI